MPARLCAEPGCAASPHIAVAVASTPPSNASPTVLRFDSFYASRAWKMAGARQPVPAPPLPNAGRRHRLPKGVAPSSALRGRTAPGRPQALRFPSQCEHYGAQTRHAQLPPLRSTGAPRRRGAPPQHGGPCGLARAAQRCPRALAALSAPLDHRRYRHKIALQPPGRLAVGKQLENL